MMCMICKRGQVKPGKVHAEIKAGNDHLLVPVEAELCVERGEAYYSAETMRYLEQVREDFLRKTITPHAVGQVFELT